MVALATAAVEAVVEADRDPLPTIDSMAEGNELRGSCVPFRFVCHCNRGNSLLLCVYYKNNACFVRRSVVYGFYTCTSIVFVVIMQEQHETTIFCSYLMSALFLLV